MMHTAGNRRWCMATEFDELLGGDIETAAPRGRTPPYIAYRTLLNLFQEFNTNGLPPQIDRSVLTRFAGGLQGQIMLALRSLDLMDAAKKPTQKLADLVAAYETPNFGATFRPIIEATYPHVIKLDLMTATPTMFAEAFKTGNDAKEDVLRKCRTFFLHAARDVGIAVGPRIEKHKYPRRQTNGTSRKPKGAKLETPGAPDGADAASGGNGGAEDSGSGAKNHITDKALEYKLIDLMREDGVGEQERSAIWTLVQYLTLKAKNKAADAKPAA